MAEKSGLKVTKTDAEKRVEAQQKVLDKSIAEQVKQTEELTKAQKEASGRFRRLTKDLANSDMSLSTTAANLSASTKDTFTGMLAQGRLAKKLLELEKAPEFVQAKALVAERNDNLAAANKVQDQNLKEQQDELARAKDNNKELKALYDKKTAIENKLEYRIKRAGDDAEAILRANLKAQKDTIEQQKKIDAQEQAIKSIYTEKIEKQTLELENYASQLAEAQDAEIKIREQGEEALKESSSSKEFDTFNNSLKSLSGGMLDIGGALDSVTKFFTDLMVVGKFIIKGWTMLGLATPKFITNIKNRFKGKDETDSPKPKTSLYQRALSKGEKLTQSGKDIMSNAKKKAFGDNKMKKDGTRDKRFKKDDGFVGNAYQNSLKGVGNTFKKMGKGLTNSMGRLSKGYAFVKTGMMGMAKGLMKIGKQMIKAMVRLALAAIPFLLGLAAAAVGMFIAALPMIGIALAVAAGVAALVFGVMWLVKKFTENKDEIMFKWGLIKEGFSIAMDGLILWKDESVAFIGSIFSKIGLGIQSMLVSILEGIENGINWVINGLNDKLGWAGVNLDTVDLGASGMRADFESDSADFEAAQQEQSDGFAARKDGLLERSKDVKDKWNDESNWSETGNAIKDATTEVKQGEKQSNLINVMNQSSSNTSNNNTQVHNSSGSPRDTDRTAVGLNASWRASA